MPFSSWSVDGLVRNPRQQDCAKRGRESALVQASDPVNADGSRQGLAYACGQPAWVGKQACLPLDATAADRPNASPGDIAGRPRCPRTASGRATRPRAVVVERPRLRLRHRRIERIRRAMRTTRRVVRPLRRIRTATGSRPRAVRAQIFIPVLLALFMSRYGATKTFAAARAERDAARGQCPIGLALGRRRRCHKRIA